MQRQVGRADDLGVGANLARMQRRTGRALPVVALQGGFHFHQQSRQQRAVDLAVNDDPIRIDRPFSVFWKKLMAAYCGRSNGVICSRTGAPPSIGLGSVPWRMMIMFAVAVIVEPAPPTGLRTT